MSNRESRLSRIPAATIALAVYLIIILFSIYPHLPFSVAGWFIVIVAGIPAALLVEGIGRLLFSRSFGKRISDKPFSLARVIFAVFVVLCYLGLVYLVWILIGDYVRPYFS